MRNFNKDVASSIPGLADWLSLILGLRGLLSLSSVLGNCCPDAAEEPTTRKQKQESLKSQKKTSKQNTSLGAL